MVVGGRGSGSGGGLRRKLSLSDEGLEEKERREQQELQVLPTPEQGHG